ncbi:nitric oxide-sensing protein NosP [Litchfieldella anticariensis]|nr:nitric oxide-sensing protein NosP [Halomonas anticariensis]
MSQDRIRTAHSRAADAREAAREFHARVSQPGMALVVFFCSSMYDLEALADELNGLFSDVPVVGCTTAGEIGPAGYLTHSLTGASFPSSSCMAATGLLQELQQFESRVGNEFAQDLLRQLEDCHEASSLKSVFSLLLVDGLSLREESVARSVQDGLGRIPVIGGSAGDDLRFERTCVFHGGAFHNDAAVLALVCTRFPMTVFKTQHFVSTDNRLVVTEADTANRIVLEINGLPAAEEYARLIGVSLAELTPTNFAEFPVIVLIDGADYVRSIQSINEDGSITFFCAIDEGLVLRVGRGVDLAGNLEQSLAKVGEEVGSPQLIFTCDCILRSLEVDRLDEKKRVGDILRRYNAVGFSTYGEQFGGLHVNQTLTGVAIGTPLLDEA